MANNKSTKSTKKPVSSKLGKKQKLATAAVKKLVGGAKKPYDPENHNEIMI